MVNILLDETKLDTVSSREALYFSAALESLELDRRLTDKCIQADYDGHEQKKSRHQQLQIKNTPH